MQHLNPRVGVARVRNQRTIKEISFSPLLYHTAPFPERGGRGSSTGTQFPRFARPSLPPSLPRLHYSLSSFGFRARARAHRAGSRQPRVEHFGVFRPLIPARACIPNALDAELQSRADRKLAQRSIRSRRTPALRRFFVIQRLFVRRRPDSPVQILKWKWNAVNGRSGEGE